MRESCSTEKETAGGENKTLSKPVCSLVHMASGDLCSQFMDVLMLILYLIGGSDLDEFCLCCWQQSVLLDRGPLWLETMCGPPNRVLNDYFFFLIIS